jgi:hypothetical protein
MEKKIQTIEITPTWEEAAPLIIDIIRNATNPRSIQIAKEELMKMAKAADINNL